MFVNGHKFAFGKARPLVDGGQQKTVFAVAHNYFGQDRARSRSIASGQRDLAVSYSAGSDGDKRWVIDLIDGEFDLPLEQITEFQVQFRPFTESLIKDIALDPRSTGKQPANAEVPQPEIRPPTVSSSSEPNVDSDGDGLSDFQEIHKYFTDPKKPSTAGDGISDGEAIRRREFTYSIRSVVKVMPPLNL